MSLNKSTLETALIAVLTKEQSEEKDATASVNRIAKGFADAFDAFVKSGQVKVTVTTTGSAAAQSGTGTGNIT
jgi:capsular polysaccharide biosynthesis protein